MDIIYQKRNIKEKNVCLNFYSPNDTKLVVVIVCGLLVTLLAFIMKFKGNLKAQLKELLLIKLVL